MKKQGRNKAIKKSSFSKRAEPTDKKRPTGKANFSSKGSKGKHQGRGHNVAKSRFNGKREENKSHKAKGFFSSS